MYNNFGFFFYLIEMFDMQKRSHTEVYAILRVDGVAGEIQVLSSSSSSSFFLLVHKMSFCESVYYMSVCIFCRFYRQSTDDLGTA